MRLDVALDGEEDLRLLRGALLAAKATELAELQRWGSRLSFGYGTDSAREGMSAEVEQRRRRIEVLDELIEALSVAERAWDSGAERTLESGAERTPEP